MLDHAISIRTLNGKSILETVSLGAFIPLVGVLFGYTHIYRAVRKSKLKIRRPQVLSKGIPSTDASSQRHVIAQERGEDLQHDVTGIAQLAGPSVTVIVPTGKTWKKEDIRLIKTLFLSFFIFLVSW